MSKRELFEPTRPFRDAVDAHEPAVIGVGVVVDWAIAAALLGLALALGRFLRVLWSA